MKSTRRIRMLSALVALVSMLFTQLALASYDCPELGRALAQAAAANAGKAEHARCCPRHDINNPGLCHAQAQTGSQSADVPVPPPVLPFVPAELLQSVAPLEPRQVAAQPAQRRFLVAPGISPPLSIRHCCLRN